MLSGFGDSLLCLQRPLRVCLVDLRNAGMCGLVNLRRPASVKEGCSAIVWFLQWIEKDECVGVLRDEEEICMGAGVLS